MGIQPQEMPRRWVGALRLYQGKMLIDDSIHIVHSVRSCVCSCALGLCYSAHGQEIPAHKLLHATENCWSS